MDYPLTYHIATPDDATMLSAWDEAPHMQIARGESDWWNWTEELCQKDIWREMLIIKHEDLAFGFLQIMNAGKDPDNYWEGLDDTHMAIDMWIGKKEFLKRGFGTQIMKFALKRAFANPRITAVWIDPLVQNLTAIRFYQKHDFQPVETRFKGGDMLHIHALSRQDWERSIRKTDGGAY